MATRTLLLVALLAAPLAAAGGADVSLDYLESSRTGCREGGNSTSDSGDGWYTSNSYTYVSCADEFHYASASVSDDEGEVAGADVRARHGSADNASSNWYQTYGEWNDSRWTAWNHNGHHANASSDAREAEVRTREGDASLSTGCDASSFGGSSERTEYSRTPYDSYYSRQHRGGSTSAQGCGTDAELARGDDRVALTPYENRCSDASRYEGYASEYEYWTWDENGTQTRHSSRSEWGDSSGESSCFSGASAGAGETDLSAGHERDCASSYSRSRYGWDNQTYGGHSYREECVDGYAVRGPDGFVLFVGTASGYESWCTYGSSSFCESTEDRRTGLSLTWAHSPLGPNPVYVPFPALA